MPQSTKQLKQKLKDLAEEFEKTDFSFQSYVIIFDFMTLLGNDERLKKLFQPKSLMKKVTSIFDKIIATKDISLRETGGMEEDAEEMGPKYLTASAKLHYGMLSLVSALLLNYRNPRTEEEKEKRKKQIDDSLKKKSYKKAFNHSMKALTKMSVDYLDRYDFLEHKNSEEALAIDNKQITYTYNENTKKGTLNITSQEPITFDKERALILDYFYKINELNKEEDLAKDNDKNNPYRTYEDFNTNNNAKIDSNHFRLAIGKINERVATKTKKIVKEIIMMKPKQASTEINYYKWEVKL